MKKVVLITGVAGGIGSVTAQVFAKTGWRVVGVDQRFVETPDDIHLFIRADIADPVAAEDLFAQVAQREGQIDALVNNAAIQICKPLLEMSVHDWDSTMASNVRSVFLAVRYAYPLMSAHGGSIVNVSSVHAIATSANLAAYAASKGALLALTRAMAVELAPAAIRVNAVLPGAVDTPMLHASLKRRHKDGSNVHELMAALGRRTIIGRVAQPAEIVQAILFLADNEHSSFMTGQALVVDGGATARLSTE